MNPVFLVLMSLMICDVVNGQLGDHCDQMEVRARTCPEALAWARGWVPPGSKIVMVQCSEQRVATR